MASVKGKTDNEINSFWTFINGDESIGNNKEETKATSEIKQEENENIFPQTTTGKSNYEIPSAQKEVNKLQENTNKLQETKKLDLVEALKRLDNLEGFGDSDYSDDGIDVEPVMGEEEDEKYSQDVFKRSTPSDPMPDYKGVTAQRTAPAYNEEKPATAKEETLKDLSPVSKTWSALVRLWDLKSRQIAKGLVIGTSCAFVGLICFTMKTIADLKSVLLNYQQ